jgi:type IV pilus assembly protein PilO
MADNALTKLPLAGQLGVSLLVAALVGGIFYYAWPGYSDMLQEEATKKAQRETLQQEIRRLEVTANKLQEFQREVQLLEAKLDTLKRILPPEKETPDVMKKVQALAAQSFLTIKRFTPAPVQQKEFYQEIPYTVDVDGSYHNLGLFFDRVGRLSRLVNVGDLKVKAAQKQTSNNTIAASCIATTFVYSDTQPQPGGPGAKRPGVK